MATGPVELRSMDTFSSKVSQIQKSSSEVCRPGRDEGNIRRYAHFLMETAFSNLPFPLKFVVATSEGLPEYIGNKYLLPSKDKRRWIFEHLLSSFSFL